MEEKEKGCRIDEWANYFLAALSSSPEERLKVLQKAFLLAAEKKDDETASKLIDFILKEYSEAEHKVALETDHNYRDADFRVNAKSCKYFRSIYWQLRKMSSVRNRLEKTKSKIIGLWMRQWRDYDCSPYVKNDEKAVDAFNFLVVAHDPSLADNLLPDIHERTQDHIGYDYLGEERDGILKLFREHTNSNFTPEIAEKWLVQPDVPEEIRKIFRIAWIRNGGQELFDRCMKNAEILKPLESENRSEAAMEYHRNFCGELAALDEKIKQLIKDLEANPPCASLETEVTFFSLESIGIKMHYHGLLSDGQLFLTVRNYIDQVTFLKYRDGRRRVRINFDLFVNAKDWGRFTVDYFAV